MRSYWYNPARRRPMLLSSLDRSQFFFPVTRPKCPSARRPPVSPARCGSKYPPPIVAAAPFSSEGNRRTVSVVLRVRSRAGLNDQASTGRCGRLRIVIGCCFRADLPARSAVDPRASVGWHSRLHNDNHDSRTDVRNASPGPNITAGRINLAEGKASSTAASPLPRLRM